MTALKEDLASLSRPAVSGSKLALTYLVFTDDIAILGEIYEAVNEIVNRVNRPGTANI